MNKYNMPHPEMQPGEIWLYNITDKVIYDEQITFDTLSWKTKRKGIVAYMDDGSILPTHYPIFVQRSELVEANANIPEQY
jgi:hypothetical protein